jgi:hypothetical protein
MAKPSSEEVTKRLLILKYAVAKAWTLPPRELLQNRYSRLSKEEQQKFTNAFGVATEQLVAPLKSNNLWNSMTEEEQEFIQSVPPNVKFQQHLNAMWCLESAVMLMWAMGIIKEFPPFDAQSSAELLGQISHQDIGKFIKSTVLLPSEEIERKRTLAELWHWRSVTRQLIEMKKAPPANSGFTSFDQIVQIAANEAFKQGDLSRLIDNDFPAKGKAYRNLNDEEWSEVRSITMERHHALNWMCGYAPGNKWDKTPTDT